MRWAMPLLPLILLVACGGDGIAKPSSSPTYEEFISPRLGYRIETPEEWTIEEDSSESNGESYPVDGFMSPLGEQDFPANVNVTSHPALGRTFDEIVAMERATLEGWEGLREDELVVAGHEAVVFHFSLETYGTSYEGELSPVDFSLLFVVIDDVAWEMWLTTSLGDRDRYMPIFEHMYNSFRP